MIFLFILINQNLTNKNFLFQTKNFEYNDLRTHEAELDNVYKSFEKIENRNSFMARKSFERNGLRQKLDRVKTETDTLRRDSNSYIQK